MVEFDFKIKKQRQNIQSKQVQKSQGFDDIVMPNYDTHVVRDQRVIFSEDGTKKLNKTNRIETKNDSYTTNKSKDQTATPLTFEESETFKFADLEVQ